MNRKIITAISVLIFLLMALLLNNQYHFLYGRPCGIGLMGLKLLAGYTGILLMILIGVRIINKRKSKDICKSCKSQGDEQWVICPYCGAAMEGREGK